LINLPNLVTLARLVMTPIIALTILHGQYGRAFVLFVIAGLTDIADGYLARRLGSGTQTGAYFDPLTDKALLVAIYFSLGAAHAMPWWMVGVVMGRDLLILGMVGWGFLFTQYRQFPPSVWGKISTFLQIVAAGGVMLARIGADGGLSPAALWTMLAATVWSGIHYAWKGIRLLRTAEN
jgi:cardiolipin synthase